MGNKRKKIIIVLFAIILGLPLVCFGLPKLINQATLFIFAQPFFNYPLPPETKEISRDMRVGVLTGNGNHCDFYANRKLETLLSEDEIRKYYRDVTFPSIALHSSIAAISELEGIVGLFIKFDPIDPQNITLELWDYPYKDAIRMLDVRCH